MLRYENECNDLYVVIFLTAQKIRNLNLSGRARWEGEQKKRIVRILGVEVSYCIINYV